MISFVASELAQACVSNGCGLVARMLWGREQARTPHLLFCNRFF